MSQPCVIPVRAADAVEWAAGRLSDRDLLLRAPLIPEAVFIVNLPDRASYRAMVRACAYWRARGAVTLITRTGTPTVASQLLKNGAVTCQVEATEPVKTRYLVPPPHFGRWIDRFLKNDALKCDMSHPEPAPG